MITADRGFIQSLGSDFLGFFFAGNFIFSRLCAGCPAVEKMTRNSEALELDLAIKFVLFSCICCLDTDAAYINISLIVIQSTLKRNVSQFKETPITKVALYLAYHLTRQTIYGFGFS